MRVPALWSLGLIFLVGPSVPATGEERLLVSNQNAGTAQLVDPLRLTTLATAPVAPQPLTVAVSPDRRYALVAGVGWTTNGGGLTVLDLTQASLPVVATVSTQARVYGVDVFPDGRTAIACRVRSPGGVELQLVDLTASPPRDLGKPLPIAGARSAYSVNVDPQGARGYVQDYSGRALYVVDLTRSPPAVVKTVATRRGTIFLRLSPDGRRLLTVAIGTPAAAEVWDVAAGPAKLATLPVGSNPGAIPAFDPGNTYGLVVAAGSGSLHVLDTHGSVPTVLASLSGVGADLRGVTASRDGLTAWAASRSQSRLVEISLQNPAAPRLTGRTIPVNRGPNHVVAFGEVHTRGVPAVGTTFPILVSSPPDAGRSYLLGASFGTRPGMLLGPHRIPLNPDNLFILSQTVPALFRAFQGQLNANGQAAAALAIPAAPALRGLSFYVAGVILDPQAPLGIRRVTNAEHIVLQ